MMPILAITHKDDAQAVYDALCNDWFMEWAKADRDETKTGRLALLMVAAHAELTRLTETETQETGS